MLMSDAAIRHSDNRRLLRTSEFLGPYVVRFTHWFGPDCQQETHGLDAGADEGWVVID